MSWLGPGSSSKRIQADKRPRSSEKERNGLKKTKIKHKKQGTLTSFFGSKPIVKVKVLPEAKASADVSIAAVASPSLLSSAHEDVKVVAAPISSHEVALAKLRGHLLTSSPTLADTPIKAVSESIQATTSHATSDTTMQVEMSLKALEEDPEEKEEEAVSSAQESSAMSDDTSDDSDSVDSDELVVASDSEASSDDDEEEEEEEEEEAEPVKVVNSSSATKSDSALIVDVAVSSSTDDEEEEEEDGDDEQETYEEQRRRNIAANHEMMAALGLESSSHSLFGSNEAAEEAKTKKKKKKKNILKKEPTQPLRRSTRQVGKPASATPLIEVAPEPPRPAPRQLALGETLGMNDDAFEYRVRVGADEFLSQGYEGFGGHDHKVYSISVLPLSSSSSKQQLIGACGGKGRVSFFLTATAAVDSMNESKLKKNIYKEMQSPVVSVKLHNRWVAEVQCLEQINEEQVNVLTASDDATVLLSQLHLTKRTLTITDRSQEHNAGVFGMHCNSNRMVASASKDACVAVVALTSTGFAKSSNIYDETFASVVKSVRWSTANEQLMAAVGNDGDIAVFDVRVPARKEVTLIESAHHQAINSIRWVPSSEHTLLTASFDRTIRLWDIRKATNTPLHTFSGHHPSHGKKPALTSPEFASNGRILTPGEGSSALSCYDIDTGACTQTYIGFTPSCIFAHGSSLFAAQGAHSLWRLNLPNV